MTIRVDTIQCRKSVKRNDYIGEDDFLGTGVFQLCLWVHSTVENIIVKTSLEIGKREFDSILYLVQLSTYFFIPRPVLALVLILCNALVLWQT